MIPKSNRLLKLVLIEKKYFLRWSTAYSFSIRNYIEYWSALLEEEICPREASNWLSSMYSRRGHSNGSTRDVLYVQQEQATGQLARAHPWLCCALSWLNPSLRQCDGRCVWGCVPFEEGWGRQKQVMEALAAIFGHTKLVAFPSIIHFLVIGLVSHLRHTWRTSMLLCLVVLSDSTG